MTGDAPGFRAEVFVTGKLALDILSLRDPVNDPYGTHKAGELILSAARSGLATLFWITQGEAVGDVELGSVTREEP